MSKSSFQHLQRQKHAFERWTTREAIRLIHLGLLKRFADTHDFPLNYEKPKIDNSPWANEGPRIYPRPARGSKRAYLRRRESERL